MHFAVLLLVAGAAFAQYDTQPSGYGNNNPGQVQYVAGKSPKNKPVDYTKGGASDFPRGGSNIIGNLLNQQNLGQTNTQGQQNIQKGGDQTNVGINTNTVNVGQTNNQNVARDAPSSYKPVYAGAGATYQGPNFPGSLIKDNTFNTQDLGQLNNQGQSSVQKGGDQTNVGANNNQVNVGQANNQGGPVYSGKPAYDAPAYGGNPQYGGAAGLNFFGNNVFAQNLGQTSNQGQANAQVGGAQTNVGQNQNAINVGQSNNQGGNGNYGGNYKPSYDAPAYGGQPSSYGAVLIPINPAYGGGPGSFVKGNNFDLQNLGQTSNQGQSNAQVGGAQTNLGANQNAVNVGQANNQGGNAGKPSYDAPSYGAGYNAGGAIYVPDFSNFIKNNVNSQNLGQTNAQGQSNAQIGGDQTNVGQNQNAINVGQSNNQGGNAGKPSYDAPSYGAGYNAGGAIYVPDFSNFIKNNVNSQNLGQANNQGQTSVQKGGDQTNVGANQNAVNVGQSNNQGAAPAKGYDAPRYGGYNPGSFFAGNNIFAQNLGQTSNQGQSNAQVGGAQTNVGANQNEVNVGQSNNQGAAPAKGYDAPRPKYTSPPAQETGGYKSKLH
ncbi:hypothetical protein Q1695_007669 [Nippostrongylus brasiliensis]|nr:hypothetical protein Q1695_007669 [Nippostrongylus brasiliensis]